MQTFLNAMFENGPSIAHRKLAEYERRGLLQGIITTNIDCLHTLAGSRNVAEIQGSYGGGYYPYIRSGAKIVQINPKATQFDDVAVLNIRKGADEVFGMLQ